MVSVYVSEIIAQIEGRSLIRESAISFSGWGVFLPSFVLFTYYFRCRCLPCNYLFISVLSVPFQLMENINFLLVCRESTSNRTIVFYLFVCLFLSYNLIASAHCVSFLCFISFLYSLIVYSLIYCVDVLLF